VVHKVGRTVCMEFSIYEIREGGGVTWESRHIWEYSIKYLLKKHGGRV
jgi:hypothetical protein